MTLNFESRIVDAEGNNEWIQLDPNTKLIDVVNYIWIPLHPEWIKLKE